MKSYEGALVEAVSIQLGTKFSDCRDVFGYSAYYLILSIYDVPLDKVVDDMRSLRRLTEARRELERKSLQKAEYKRANEERRLANLSKK